MLKGGRDGSDRRATTWDPSYSVQPGTAISINSSLEDQEIQSIEDEYYTDSRGVEATRLTAVLANKGSENDSVTRLYAAQDMTERLNHGLSGFSSYVTFKHVACTVPPQRNLFNLFGLLGVSEEKTLLQDISGVVKPGQLLAIMGPSGSGKTTLLDILAGKDKTGKVSGEVLVNGKPPGGKLWKRTSGYVMQDDVLYPSFTVRETLEYAARLRLPSSIPDWRKMQRVEIILNELCLMEVAESLIGGEFVRGISGGEKRRVSIGIELVTDPSLLFLDEPTSGLDSYSAALVMDLLKKMAVTHNKTIICTIHQPSSLIYAKFDQLMILAPKGRLIYMGAASEASDYFAARGFPCPSTYNPADFFLELVSSEGFTGLAQREKSENSIKVLSESFLITDLGEQLQAELRKFHVPVVNQSRFSLVLRKDQSEESEDEEASGSGDEGRPFIRHSRPSHNSLPQPQHSPPADTSEFANNVFVQFFILSHRNILRYWRSPIMVGQFAFGYIFAALLLSLLFSDLKQNIPEQLTLGIGFMLNSFAVMSFFAIPRYQSQRLLFNRERATGAYRTSVYLLSNIICQLPLDIITCIVYTAIDFYVIGFYGTFEHNALFLLLLNFLTMEVFLGFNETIGASLARVDTALVCGGLSNISSLTLCGILVQYPNIPNWLRWAYWVSPLTYSVSAGMLNQFETQPFVLDAFGLQLRDRWECIYILIGWAVFFRITTFFSLWLLQREKR